MKCKHCDGAGFYENGASQFKCVYCDGTGEVEQTEQEWLQTATTEQLAEWIARRVNESVETALHDDYLHDGKIDWNDYMVRSDDIAEWLKQPHHSE